MSNVLLIGNGAREHAIAEAIRKSPNTSLFSYMKGNNPGIASLSEAVLIGSYKDVGAIISFAGMHQCDLAVIGPEDPLNDGIVDSLKEAGIPAVGPTKALLVWRRQNPSPEISSKNTGSPEILSFRLFPR